MDIMQYIKPELLAVIPICWGTGMFLKKTPNVKDWLIPYILLGVSTFLCGLWVLANEGITPMSIFTAITQGILLAVASVGSNQLVRQAGKRGIDE